MAVDIEQRLAAAAASLREREAVVARCRDLQDQIEELAENLVALRAAQADEERDVARLRGVSFARLVAALRSTRDDALARERAEADEARRRVAAAEVHLAATRRERAAALRRLDELATAPAAYRAVLADQARHLTESGDPRGPRLLVLTTERRRLDDELHRVVEALRAAETAQRALFEALGNLSRASGWSAFDTFFGGGLITSLFKHSRLNRAGDAALDADECLAVLRAKLAPLAEVEGRPASVRPVAVDGVTRVVDVWFDNVVTDFLVGNRIGAAQDDVGRAIEQVRAVQHRLWQRAEHTRERLDALDDELAGLRF